MYLVYFPKACNNCRPGMSGNDFFTFGIGNGKWPSLFPIFRIGSGNKKYNSQILGLGMGMKNQIPNFWDWEWE